MQQIDFMIKELEDNNQKKILQRFKDEHLKRWKTRFPYVDLFLIPTGKDYGSVAEANLIKRLNGLTKHLGDPSYDAEYYEGNNLLKIEIKSLRAIKSKSKKTDEDEDKYIMERIISIKEKNKKFSTSSFQQVKPTNCDWFIFHIQYGDGERLFIIPSTLISRTPGKDHCEFGKLPLSKQHDHNKEEGQINIGQVLKYKEYFEISPFNDSKSYNFADLKKEISSRLDGINWMLPECG